MIMVYWCSTLNLLRLTMSLNQFSCGIWRVSWFSYVQSKFQLFRVFQLIKGYHFWKILRFFKWIGNALLILKACKSFKVFKFNLWIENLSRFSELCVDFDSFTFHSFIFSTHSLRNSGNHLLNKVLMCISFLLGAKRRLTLRQIHSRYHSREIFSFMF